MLDALREQCADLPELTISSRIVLAAFPYGKAEALADLSRLTESGALEQGPAAALLAAGRPLSARELAGVLDVPLNTAEREIRAFGAALDAAGLGFHLEAVAGGYRLVVPPEGAARLAPILAPPPLPALSGAALEVLAVIAYRQPVTRAEIEAMRGGSAGTVVTLQERELVKVVGRSDAVG